MVITSIAVALYISVTVITIARSVHIGDCGMAVALYIMVTVITIARYVHIGDCGMAVAMVTVVVTSMAVALSGHI